MDWIEELRVLPGILYAMALGGAIGFERELKDRPAGFRTHMLVAGTAALLLGLSRMILEDAHYAGTGLQIDPLRLVEAVVAGISFIGAGTIFARRSTRPSGNCSTRPTSRSTALACRVPKVMICATRSRP